MNQHAMKLLEAIRDMVQSKEFGAQVLAMNDTHEFTFSGKLTTDDGHVVANIAIGMSIVGKDDPKPH